LSGRVCYVKRTDRGDRIESVRVLGGRSEATWTGSVSKETDGPVALIQSAADWVAASLAAAKSRRLAAVCVDGAGSLCSWLTVPSGASAVVRAAYAQHGGFEIESSEEEIGDEAVQALISTGVNGSARRVAAIGVHDAAAGVFLDRLDDKGIAPNQVVSMWHAMASAWDPSARETPSRDDDSVVARAAPTTGIVLVDPDGRVLWAWSRQGSLIAAGEIRLLTDLSVNGKERKSPLLTPEVAGRVVADWLAWSVQVGCTPSRVICITPEAPAKEGTITHAEFGRRLGEAWPGASVDVAVHDDPIGVTLERLLEDAPDTPESDPTTALVGLSTRPARAHRGMYYGAAVVLTAMALVSLGVSIKLWRAAGGVAERVPQVEADTRAMLESIDSRLASDLDPLRALSSRITARRQELSAAATFTRPRPILEELDTIAIVLDSNLDQPGWEGTRINQINLTSLVGRLEFLVPSTAIGEQLAQAMRNIESGIRWNEVRFENAPRGDATWTKTTLTGAWIEGGS